MNQNIQILAHLRNHSLTALGALEYFSCFRLAARINELRSNGHPIESKLVKIRGKMVARYTLEEVK